jgi:hypothetical protein
MIYAIYGFVGSAKAGDTRQMFFGQLYQDADGNWSGELRDVLGLSRLQRVEKDTSALKFRAKYAHGDGYADCVVTKQGRKWIGGWTTDKDRKKQVVCFLKIIPPAVFVQTD